MKEAQAWFQHTAARRRLPLTRLCSLPVVAGFQHTAARRRLRELSQDFQAQENVSTHSRPKAAAQINNNAIYQEIVSTHSRPKAAAISASLIPFCKAVSTHSRPKAAASRRLASHTP